VANFITRGSAEFSVRAAYMATSGNFEQLSRLDPVDLTASKEIAPRPDSQR
jgi:hypothetical protein